ncbi:adenosylmethionine decarboxylase [Methylophilus sp. Leaf408]|uniref:adenosylmethionine decarboxylase n=1 Tax=Methylophilus sp. Leaf408 TaxID=2876561 RepID=UPI001E645D35|nr:adenosylmethionine decarboxylase [Methylophilus sp. Leaf408]
MKRLHYSGLHLIANLHKVDHAIMAMTDLTTCKSVCVDAVRKAGLTIVGECFHDFGDQQGVTGALVLAESHLAIHTWPESGYVTLDVFVCNYKDDNSEKARQLFESLIEAFGPGKVQRSELQRE